MLLHTNPENSLKSPKGYGPAWHLYSEIWVTFSVFFGPRTPTLHQRSEIWHGGVESSVDSSIMPNVTHNVLPLRGEKPQNCTLSNQNAGVCELGAAAGKTREEGREEGGLP